MFPVRVALGFLLIAGAAVGQQYVISTVAGGAPPNTPVRAVDASIGSLLRVTTDAAGNVYFSSFNCVFKIDQNGVLTRVAGNSRGGYSGDGGPATSAQFNGAGGVAVDTAGNLYIADINNYRVRKVSVEGIITTVAGGGDNYPGDGGPATSAILSYLWGVAVSASGDLYIADEGSGRVRKVSPTGNITTVAGNGTLGYSGDGGLATGAQLNIPRDVAVDASGNLYIADFGNYCVRKVSPTGIITTVAGNGTGGDSGDGALATSAQLRPQGVAVDASGNLYITDPENGRVRKVTVDGIITTAAGDGPCCISADGDGGPATSAQLRYPWGVAADSKGNLYVADYTRVRKVSAAGIITTVAGNGTSSYSGDGGPATSAQMDSPTQVALDANRNLYIADSGNYRVRKVSPTGVITSVAGNGTFGYSGDGGPATSAQLVNISGIAADAIGSLYFADAAIDRIRKVSPTGVVSTVAGNGTRGYSGDGGPATNAQLNGPSGMAVDSSGNLYLADAGNARVRKVSPSGTITTVAGNGTPGYSGDGGSATSAQLYAPTGVAVDVSGNLFITDPGSSRVRKVSPSGTITTVAGNGGDGYSGDGGPATSAQVFHPSGVAVDASGNLFITDFDGGHVRRVSVDGIIMTVAGDGTKRNSFGYSGDGGPATSAKLNDPTSVAVDSSGNVYAADTGNNAIRLLQQSPSSLTVSTITNAASNFSGPIASGEMVIFYGSRLGPSQMSECHIDSDGVLDTQCSGTQVFFNGTSAPLIYTWATQVAAIVPYSVSGDTAQVTVSYQGQNSVAQALPIAASAPGIFTLDSTGKGQAAAANSNGSLNTAGTPARAGDVITLFATGEGQTNPAGVDGKPAADPLPRPALPITVSIGGQNALVQYAGGAPGEVAGVLQVNVQIPNGIQAGNAVPVSIQVGSVSSQSGVTIAVQ